MNGAKVLSRFSDTHTAITAASSGTPSGRLPEEIAAALVAATQGRLTNLKGGPPILMSRQVVGAVGVGSVT